MSFITAAMIGAGGALLGGYVASQGAKSAASTQAEAATRAGDLQKQQFEQQMALQEPYRQAGLVGQNRLMTLLGLGGQQPTGGAGGGLFGGVGNAVAGAAAGPYVGGDASSADYGKYAKDFSMADYQADPGYAFRLSEGMKALSHKAGSRGGLVSGTTMKGMQDYIQNSASQEYGNAFNRYQTNRANQLQPLGSLMSSGQAAASNQAGAAGQYGSNAGNTMMAAGQAIGAGQLGAANTLAGGLGTAASAYQNQTNFTNWLNRNQPSAATLGPTTMPGYDVNYYDGTYQGR
jgi:hypothetical protein